MPPHTMVFKVNRITSMKFKSFLLIALAAATLTATAKTPKKKTTKKAVTEKKLTPVAPATFSYAMGVGQSASLKSYLLQREGVDSAYIGFAAKALQEASSMSEAQIKQAEAYAAGLRIAKMNKDQVIPSLNQSATGKKDSTYTDLALFTKGLAEGLTDKASISADSAMKIAEQQFNFRDQQIKQENLAYLTKNAKEKDVKVTPSGLQYKVLKQGTGAVATDTTEVEVHYEGKLIDGTVFDSSYKRNQPATFRPNQVIKGWTEALKMMPEGSVYELTIPYNLAYGERGNQGIPPFATLIFKVEVLKVKTAADAAKK